MSTIHLLDSSVFNRIAAGEVVENPRSVVKELVENSIDAGADTIHIEIRGGGIEYIRITDNGKGLTKEDMPLAFLPHATSKIRNLRDLDEIRTLGFRGEALPSIASVADMEMTSRTAENELGYTVVLSDGKITDEGKCGAPFGTQITVRNLFSHIPARAKFLRKPQIEESAVTEYIIKLILSNPAVKIKYSTDGQLQYHSDGNGVDAAIYNVYGSEFIRNMAPISYAAPDITISGWIGKPNFTKHNRNYQTLIVNGRYIVHAEISFCIQQCYREYLIKRQFPVYVLYLNIPADTVDVNVHPNKLDVRFVNEKRIKGILYNTVKAKVDELAAMPIEFPSSNTEIAASFEPIESRTAPAPHISVRDTAFLPPTSTPPLRPHIQLKEDSDIRSRIHSFAPHNEHTAVSDTSESSEPPIAPFHEFLRENTNIRLQTRYAGKLFNTYLLVESGNDFYIIDQHAAHEKLLYDTLVSQYEQGETALQDLLVPYIFDVSPEEKPTLTNNLPQLAEFGFKIDPLSGNSFCLHAVPACCSGIDLKQFVAVLMSEWNEKKNATVFVKEKLMQAACKSAVKGEDDLSDNEIAVLIEQLQQSGSTKFCPHGRPIIVHAKRSDLEKLFKRI